MPWDVLLAHGILESSFNNFNNFHTVLLVNVHLLYSPMFPDDSKHLPWIVPNFQESRTHIPNPIPLILHLAVLHSDNNSVCSFRFYWYSFTSPTIFESVRAET